MKRTTWMQVAGTLFLLAGAGVARAEDVNAGPIWNQADANNKCPGVCDARKEHWNGQWRTTVPNKMSVCGCEAVKPPPSTPTGGNKVAKDGGKWEKMEAPKTEAAPAK